MRMQTSTSTQFRGPLDCVMQTVRKEGVTGFFKGVTPPLVGWVCMDSMWVFPTQQEASQAHTQDVEQNAGVSHFISPDAE